MKLRDLQAAHEQSVLDSFKRYLSSLDQKMKIISQPDPPDAIIELNGEPGWIEITDAFQSAEWAKSITSYAADDKPHRPYNRGAMYEPDMVAIKKVCEVIQKKYQKQTMKDLYHSSGQGILLVGAYTPLTTLNEIVDMGRGLVSKTIQNEIPVFSAIYVYQNSETGHHLIKLL